QEGASDSGSVRGRHPPGLPPLPGGAPGVPLRGSLGARTRAGADYQDHRPGRSRRRRLGGRDVWPAVRGEGRGPVDRSAAGRVRCQEGQPQPATAEGLLLLVLEQRVTSETDWPPDALATKLVGKATPFQGAPSRRR